MENSSNFECMKEIVFLSEMSQLLWLPPPSFRQPFVSAEYFCGRTGEAYYYFCSSNAAGISSIKAAKTTRKRRKKQTN
jgi:hypothetical protein